MHKPRGRAVLIGILVAIGALAVALIGFAVGGMQAGSNLSVSTGQMASPGGYAAREEMSYGSPVPESKLAQSPEAATTDSSVEAGSQGVAPTETLIIRNSAMEVRVENVDKALADLRQAVAQAGGEIADMSVTAGDPGVVPLEGGSASSPTGPSIAYVTIRVPAQKLSALEADVAGLGKVLTQSSSANDVTEQAVDMEARLKNMRAEEARLRSLFNRTDDVGDLLAVERELARVRGEIEAMDAQLTYLKRQAARATLAVTLSEPGPVVQPSGPTWGLREAVTRGIQATASLLAAAVTVAIPLAVFGAIGLLLWLPIRALLRRRTARTQAAESDMTPSKDEAL